LSNKGYMIVKDF